MYGFFGLNSAEDVLRVAKENSVQFTGRVLVEINIKRERTQFILRNA